MGKEISKNPQIWGGFECTINRIKNTYKDQFEISGHYNREDDIDKVAALGIKALRYPVLWEKHQPIENEPIKWSWATKQLNKIRAHNIIPIVGLLHHGSGPAFTNLLDEKFPEKLAAYAAQVASQFPWVEYYTPVNEPLTTARFSGLYGFWYPHKTNDVSFVRMLLNQVKGVVLSMQAIRAINPAAKLVQTEDLSKTYSTPVLKYQADFENSRRWFTYDLLTGKIVAGHPMWNYCLRLGITSEELLFFVENTCTPNIMGVNYYVTSERFLDDDYTKYPVPARGGNDIHKYADVEAVRVEIDEPCGFKVVMKEIWERYQVPLAVTEAHLGCTREEQLRWLKEIWESTLELVEQNIDIKAVTAWALTGSYGWNSLLAADIFDYEYGVFVVRNNAIHPTALTALIKKIASGEDYTHSLLSENGWWKKKERLIYYRSSEKEINKVIAMKTNGLLIVGKNGTLGRAFAKICSQRSIQYRLVSRAEMDICNEDAVKNMIAYYRPWAIINTAGFVRVDDAETEQEACFRDNTVGVEILTKTCKRYGIKLMTFSSDLVFDGLKTEPYVESDMPAPLNIYGKSKYLSEKIIKENNDNSLIIRTSAFFSFDDKYNFLYEVIATLKQGKQFAAANDLYISPTYVPHLVAECLHLLIDDESGIFHLSNKAILTWAEFACEAAKRAGFSTKNIIAKPVAEFNLKAKRPMFVPLVSERGIELPTLDHALDAYFYEMANIALSNNY